MPKLIKFIFDGSAPLRSVFHIISIISIIFMVMSLVYNGFFSHRTWVNERVAKSYQQLETKQTQVLQLVLSTVPNLSNDDEPPTKEQVTALRNALAELAGSVTQVDAIGEEMVIASNNYRKSIAELSGALVRYTPQNPSTQGKLLLAIDYWDKSAQSFAKVVEARIGSFRQTLIPSV